MQAKCLILIDSIITFKLFSKHKIFLSWFTNICDNAKHLWSIFVAKQSFIQLQFCYAQQFDKFKIGSSLESWSNANIYLSYV